jgi:hypothetical protein
MVVLWREFWLQSMKIFPLRSFFVMFDSTNSGSFCSSSWATARAKSEAWSCSWGVLSGT